MSLLRNADLATRSVVRSFGISRTALANDASPVKRIHKAYYAYNRIAVISYTCWLRSLTATSRLCAMTLNAKRAIQIPLLVKSPPSVPRMRQGFSCVRPRSDGDLAGQAAESCHAQPLNAEAVCQDKRAGKRG